MSLLNLRIPRTQTSEVFRGLLLLIVSFCFIHSSSGATAYKLLEFVESPPAVKEMVVELQWYRSAANRVDTNWVALCLQTNAYVFRISTNRVQLFSKFDTNNDSIILVHDGGFYATVENYKFIGPHVEITTAPTNTGPLDVTGAKIAIYEDLVSHILGLGIPLPRGSIRFSNEVFFSHELPDGRTMHGMALVNDGQVSGFALTNELSGSRRKSVLLSVRYSGAVSPELPWFPKTVEREALVNGNWLRILKMTFHGLELGNVASGEFDPNRFLSPSVRNKIMTSNGVSFVSINGATKPILPPDHPQASGIVDLKSPNQAKAVLWIRFTFGGILLVSALGILLRFLKSGKSNRNNK